MALLGRYTLLKCIGRGGMAEVWKAQAEGEAGFKKPVAIKKMLDDVARDPELLELFIAEAKLVAQLQHANIVQVFDFGLVEDVSYFIAMELVEGTNVAEILKHRALPLDVSLYITVEVAKALQYAHTRRPQVVHRDVSPHNILISNAGEVKVTDFGIAKVMGAMPRTAAGVVRGKLAYLSPEQAQLKDLDPRADIFALGLVMYELVNRERFFPVRHLTPEFIKRVRDFDEPGADQLEEMPGELRSILKSALQGDRDQRFQSAEAMSAAILDVVGSMRLDIAATQLAELVAEEPSVSIRPEDESTATGTMKTVRLSGVGDKKKLADAIAELWGDAPAAEERTGTAVVEQAGQDTEATRVSAEATVIRPQAPAPSFPSASPAPRPATPPTPPPRRRRSLTWLVFIPFVLGAGLLVFNRVVNRTTPTPTPTTLARVSPAARTPSTPRPRATTRVRPKRTPKPTPKPTQRSTPRPTPQPTVKATAAPTPVAVPKTFGWLTVNAQPWVEVWIDGRRIAKETPLRQHRLATGTHELVLVHKNIRARRKIEIRKNANTDLFAEVSSDEIRIR